ncbi:MAG: ABC transporter ATP-binding protein [Desulfobacteraceae bacterium]|jgi:lipopolysaccharide transport system ATP-binding protein|nr:ABC transporter ATP-binding protein [Desulfobacteraceae bacterium]
MNTLNLQHKKHTQTALANAPAVLETDTAIKVSGVSKVYNLYRNKKDRLKEALHPRRKKYHKEFFALKNIDLEVKKGEILGIVGKNGSGKSTFLKTIAGVLTPTTGTVEKYGKIIPLLELGAGFNPQFTGMENIYFYCSLLGYRKEDIDNMLDEILDFAEIGDFIHQPIKTYSSGMKARLAFAVSVNVVPDILILDEVLSVGDVLFRRKCFARMEQFFKGGKTILFVSHDTNSVNQLCTRAVLLDGGEILLDANPKTVTMYYEKMLFAKSENAQKIRREIRDLNHAPPAEKQRVLEKAEKPATPANPARKEPPKVIPIPAASKQKAYFIEELKPKSSLEYRNYDVDIFDIKITTPEGEQVNCLLTGDKYIYSYKVKFGIPASDVVVAMMIKDEKGACLYHTANMHGHQFIPKVLANDVYEVKFEFECNLLRGIFYTNAGVGVFSSNGIDLLNRIVDALVFKVIPSDSNLRSNGVVFLNGVFTFTKV